MLVEADLIRDRDEQDATGDDDVLIPVAYDSPREKRLPIGERENRSLSAVHS